MHRSLREFDVDIKGISGNVYGLRRGKFSIEVITLRTFDVNVVCQPCLKSDSYKNSGILHLEHRVCHSVKSSEGPLWKAPLYISLCKRLNQRGQKEASNNHETRIQRKDNYPTIRQ